jgi:hypothetical protein
LFIDKYQTSMPKLTQWAEDNIPEGLSIFGLGLASTTKYSILPNGRSLQVFRTSSNLTKDKQYDRKAKSKRQAAHKSG